MNFIYINVKISLDAISNAIDSYANKSEAMVQNVTLLEFTMVINDTSMHDSVLINGSPYQATTSPFLTTTEQTSTETSSSASPIHSNTLSNI